MSYIDLENQARGSIEVAGFDMPSQPASTFVRPVVANASNASIDNSSLHMPIEYVHDASLTALESADMVCQDMSLPHVLASCPCHMSLPLVACPCPPRNAEAQSLDARGSCRRRLA